MEVRSQACNTEIYTLESKQPLATIFKRRDAYSHGDK